ncbi:unnamed protein product [Lepeophtheirus salmonis]|uniref:(salmon louse) hypothetical protein n=1 Tax=Lepeophtheirus salmonis TaxID=72036 RepID=A0A7R8CNZ0_LEPSM|nr:unnamed protein product [Lepeophtheirus salmonis]CAF2876603.1 unnamed protein product [Lepeophtheirus salmonis]
MDTKKILICGTFMRYACLLYLLQSHKIWSNSDIVAVGELQLIWEDKNANQILSSLRLYFLPEYTPEGRLHTHGEDEVVAVSEKAVLRVVDLLDWIARPSEVVWDHHSLYPDFLSDIRQEKVSIGDLCAKDDLAVIIRSVPQYTRYRSLLKRIAGQEKAWISNSLVLALGGFTAPTRNTFCSLFPGSPESESASSESSLSTPVPVYKAEKSTSSKNGVKKDLVLILSQKNTKEELDFLKRLIRFMERRHTPIERPPMLGFKQIDLHLFFFDKVSKLGGYEACMSKKLWKAVYDDIGGNPQNTSAATCTRRHYEKFLLPYEHDIVEDESVERDSASSPSNMDTKVDKSETLNNSLASSQKQQSSPNPEEYKNEDESENNAADTSIEGSQHEQQADSPTSEPPPALTNSAPAITNKNEMSESIPDEMDKKEAEEEENTRSSLSPQLMRNIKDSAGEIIPDVTITKQSVPKPSGSPLISQLNNMEQRMQSESPQMHIDPDGKRLQIDDLIIIPNNINAGTPEGGSALQNLAKIASRYQNQDPSYHLMRDQHNTTPLPLPFSNGNNKKGGGLGASGMNSAAAASLFSLLPPNVLSTPWTSKTQTTTSNSPSKSLFSSFPGLADAMKLGADGYHLLQFYENQMKSAANALATNPSSGGSPSRNPSSTGGLNSEALLALYEKELKTAQQSLSAKLNGGSSKTSETTTPKLSVPVSSPSTTPVPKDRNKVCKPPPETKRPPSLMQTPCAFVQTTNIYTNPLSELTQVREAAKTQQHNSQTAVQGLDLTFSRYSTASSGTSSPGILNLKTEKYLMDLSVKKEGLSVFKSETKANPFSAEALLSKPTKHPDLAKVSPSLSVRSGLTMSSGRSSTPELSFRNSKPPSPATPPAVSKSQMVRSSNYPATSHSPSIGGEGSKRSPWHTPVGSSRNNSPVTSGKPAIPVSPVVRENKMKQQQQQPNPADFASSLMGLANSFMPQSSGGNSNSSVAAQVNPYLALMASTAAGGGLPSKNLTSSHGGSGNPPGFPQTPLMDPATSAYYAALYSQQMFGAAGLNPFAGLGSNPAAAGLRPAFHTPTSVSSGNNHPSQSTGLDHLQASALQAMMARSSAAAAAAAAAANPYNAANYAGLTTGFLGLPPHPPRKDT